MFCSILFAKFYEKVLNKRAAELGVLKLFFEETINSKRHHEFRRFNALSVAVQDKSNVQKHVFVRLLPLYSFHSNT